MFYIKEIIFRFQYVAISFFLIVLLCYAYRNLLLYFLTFSILSNGSESPILGVNYLIYTHPSELLTTYLLVIFYFSILFVLPYIFWNALDFLKSSLVVAEYFRLKILLVLLAVCIIAFNLFCFIRLFPNFWFFFESFNNNAANGVTTLNFFLELRIQDYFLFLSSFLRLTNTCLSFLLLVYFLFSFYGLKNLLHWKKLFIFLNIVFATLLSPPDVYSQLLIFSLLTFNFEILVFCYTLYYKICKYSRLFNTAAY